jgi:hypothetical protein
MYSILFHIAGIAIVEINFYFLYIGPVESNIFKHKIRQLLYGSEETIYNILDEPIFAQKPTQIIIRKIVQDYVYSDYDKDSLEHYFYNQNIEGERERRIQNNQLFIQSLIYWAYFAALSVFTYGVYYKYNQYIKLQKNNGIVVIDSSDEYVYENATEIELMEMRLYRKGSIDDDQLETRKSKNRCCDKSKIYKIIFYTIFGGCLLTFQFFFFDCIVSKYEPLSNGELVYIVYRVFQPSFEEIGLH